MQVNEQAVEAAQAEYRRQGEKNNWYSWPCDESMMSTLTAAAPYMSGVKVKQLEWEQHHDVWRCDKHPEYEITRWWLDEEPKQLGHFEIEDALGADQFGTLEEAQAAAQADFEKRILSALEPSSAREQALEEAAKLCDRGGAWDIADAIRALKSQPVQTGGGDE